MKNGREDKKRLARRIKFYADNNLPLSKYNNKNNNNNKKKRQ